MIVVAGLTPAYQQIQIHDAIRPGEVNRARDVRWCASGKSLNVAVALSRFGGPLLTIAPLSGLAGRTIEREFEEMDVPARWVFVKAPTRVGTSRRAGPSAPAGAQQRGATAQAVEHADEMLGCDRPDRDDLMRAQDGHMMRQ